MYLTAFQLSILQRESCMNCKYATPNRVSDITIGDFWGIQDSEKINKEEKEKGISLALINTEKGKKFFEICSPKIFLENRKIEEAVNGNAHLRRSSSKNELRIKFREKYNGDFVYTIKRVLRLKMIKQFIRLYLKK